MSDTTTAPAAADAATQAALERLNTVIDRLIAPDGCPWDSTQTPESLTEYVIEECHELVDAIRSGKTADMVEELGDVAFLILLIGKLMARAGGPSLADALEVEAAKMVRRHPHVFSDTTYENQSEQLKDWDRIKREEKAAADAEVRMTALERASLYSAATGKSEPAPPPKRKRGDKVVEGVFQRVADPARDAQQLQRTGTDAAPSALDLEMFRRACAAKENAL